MFVRSLARASTLFSAFVGALLVLIAPVAHATAPVFTGSRSSPSSTTRQLSINLRDAERHRRRTVDQRHASATSSSTVSPAAWSAVDPIIPTQAPTTVCLQLEDEGFDPTRTTVPSPSQLTATNGSRRVHDRNRADTAAAGSDVDSARLRATGLCGDPNQRRSPMRAPIAPSTTPTAQPGETVALERLRFERS